MSWIAKNPFRRGEDPVNHLVLLLSVEANKSGIVLSDLDKKILVAESSSEDDIPSDLRERTRDLVTKILQAESLTELLDEDVKDPKSFGASLRWAGDRGYANIVVIAEEVIRELGQRNPLRGWRLVKDKLELIGCGLLVVMFMLAAVITAGFWFHWK